MTHRLTMLKIIVIGHLMLQLL